MSDGRLTLASMLARLRRLDIDPLPIRRTMRGYRKEWLADDVRAGLNVALLAFPQGIAFAAIAGLPTQYGLYGAAVAALAGALFSGSRFVTLGPTNATSALVMGSFLALGIGAAERPIMIPLLVSMVGLFLIVGSLLRVANFVQYISRSVATGYIAGAAMLIIANQARKALGYDIEESATFFDTVWRTASSLPETHSLSLLISALTLVIYIACRKIKKVPAVATTLVLISCVSLGLRWGIEHTALGAALGNPVWSEEVCMVQPVLASDWRLTPPPLRFEWISSLASIALAIAFLATLEATSIGKTLAARAGARLDANQEMYGMGMANLFCGFLNGMPASGSLTRSQLIWASGSKSGMSNVVNGAVCAVAALTLGPFTRYIPEAGLAVTVICIAVSLFNKRAIQLVLRSTRSDAIVFTVTLIASLLFKLDTAIYLGAATSILLFLRKAASPELVEYAYNEEGQLAALGAQAKRGRPEVSIVHCEGDLFFGAAELVRDQMRRICSEPDLRIVVLKLRNARHLDATTVMALEELINYMKESDRTLLVSEARADVRDIFERSGLIDSLGRENFFPDQPENPTLSTAQALKRAMAMLGGETPEVSIYFNTARNKEKKGS